VRGDSEAKIGVTQRLAAKDSPVTISIELAAARTA